MISSFKIMVVNNKKIILFLWKDWLEFAFRLFDSVIDKTWPTLLKEEHYELHQDDENKKKGLIVAEIPSDYSGFHIVSCYDSLIDDYEKEKPLPNLLNRYLSWDDAPEKTLLTTQAIIQENKTLLGHANQQHPLTPSQRESFTYFSQMESGDILAINGPPGTGKTTLIQNMIANKLVEAALKKEKTPPLVLVSSTNNQAICNVIDTLSLTLNDNPLSQRWLPDLYALATYFTNDKLAKAFEARGYLCAKRIPQKMELGGSFSRHEKDKKLYQKSKYAFYAVCF